MWQVISLLTLIALVWVNEAFDLAALISGVPPQPADWGSASVLTVGIGFVGLAGMMQVYRQKRQIARESVTICSYCRKVQFNRQSWDHIEDFFSERTFATLSHGVCPDCGAKVMHDYRCGKKNAGARDTIAPEMVA